MRRKPYYDVLSVFVIKFNLRLADTLDKRRLELGRREAP